MDKREAKSVFFPAFPAFPALPALLAVPTVPTVRLRSSRASRNEPQLATTCRYVALSRFSRGIRIPG